MNKGIFAIFFVVAVLSIHSRLMRRKLHSGRRGIYIRRYIL